MPRLGVHPDDDAVSLELDRLLRDIRADYDVLGEEWQLVGTRNVPTGLRVLVRVAMGPELEVWAARAGEVFDWTVKGTGRGMFTSASEDEQERAAAYSGRGWGVRLRRDVLRGIARLVERDLSE